MAERIAFIGGGNMASALISGMLVQGTAAAQIDVVEPMTDAQTKLKSHFGIVAQAHPGSFLEAATLVVWALKPQTFKEAALQIRYHTRNALHLSVAAGIRSDSIARWLGTEQLVRAMPNTPALIRKGITALYARAEVSAERRLVVERAISATGEFLWFETEDQLDAVTALSGSGPAYVFYFMEAMISAGADMGLTRQQAYQLAVATFIGAGELARSSNEPPEILRQRVTSKGGTTHAAINSMDQSGVKTAFVRALHEARRRARELGDEFGA